MSSFTSSLTGMRGFSVVWAGQVASLFGTGMSRIAMTLWMFQTTGEATALALGGFFGFAPGIILAPIAGALVDRWNRKVAMLISDVAAGISTLALLMVILLAGIEQLQPWHLYLALFVASCGETFQFPAYSSAISTMLDKSQYARASGMQSIAEGASGIFSPVLGTVLYAAIGLQGVFIIDLITLVIAISALMLVRIPQPEVSQAGIESRSGGFLNEVLYGFRYIFSRPSLFGLQMVFFFVNLTGTFAFTVMPVLILLRTTTAATPQGDEVVLGFVQSVGSIGLLLGGLLISTLGGPKRKVHGVLGGMIASSLMGAFVIGLGRAPIFWAIGAFFSSFWIPILNGSNQAIWQAKVAPDVQGRVFATRRVIAQVTIPVAMLMAGPLADQFFSPGMMEGGQLTPIFGWLVGEGLGAGASVMFVLSGILGIIVGLSGYLFPAIRNAETLLPDHVQVKS